MTSWARSRAASLASRLLIWVLTVLWERVSSAAISSFGRPRPISARTALFARGELGERLCSVRRPIGSVVEVVLDESREDRWREQRLAAVNAADRVDEFPGVGVFQDESARACPQGP